MSNTIKAPEVEAPDFVRSGLNLAGGSLGAKILSVADEFFAPGERTLSPASPVFYPHRFDGHGKWMAGWENRVHLFWKPAEALLA